MAEDCFRTWEAMFFGAIPIVRNSTLWPLYEGAPAYVLTDWLNVELEQFESFRLATTSKKYLLAQYWFDYINSFRGIEPFCALK